MNVEDKRAKLRIYGAYKKEHDRLHRELINHMKETNNRAYINSPKYSHAPNKQEGNHIDFTDMEVNRMDKERELIIKNRDIIQKVIKLGNEIEAAISKIDNIKLRMILEMRYLYNCTFTEIGEMLKYDRTTVWRNEQKALELIEF